ncbi:helicase associated domain-containing protein, partial [Kitasatospora sp. NPDC047058]|uniref:helicase associated domain-containing protein n=1 Tax=Kitasatospora sp. NPDC047058 TaxID=3155620 RepID=UPI0033D4114C
MATRADAVVDGFALGQWMTNQRARHIRMPAEHVAVLSALDPWWAVPWTTLWQRTYHHARTHATAHGPYQAQQGFPGTSYSLGEWLYQQCVRYEELHPEQQRLLAAVGIDQAAARNARPRRRSIRAHGEEAVAHAQAYADAHAGLVTVTGATVHEGFPLGRWLTGQRSRAGRGDLSPERARALAAIDPWWRPSWGLNWQRSYQRIRVHLSAAGSDDPAARWGGLDSSTRAWLRRQWLRLDVLHLDQQRLLSEIGIPLHYVTAHRPRPTPPVHASKPVSKPVRKVERARPETGGARPGGRPGQRARVDAALEHARSWAAVHGHLAVPRAARLDGFPLGEWLLRQRNQASRRARLGLPPSPGAERLTAIDPWWNPPWKLTWQRSYYRARDHQQSGRPFDAEAGVPAATDALGMWIRRQCTAYAGLHPGQQHLLAAIGVTEEAARHRTGPRSSWRLGTTPQFDTDVVRARAYAAEHGHLVPTADERYDGFPIGRWLNEHRQRARRTGDTSPQARALAAIDPWWNPPWPLSWQRGYRRAEALGGPQDPHAPHSVRKWAQVQRSCWPVLHPQQQQLLTRIGITTAAASVPQRPGR